MKKKTVKNTVKDTTETLPQVEKNKEPCSNCKTSSASELRALADYQNLQRETAQQKLEFAKYANQGLIEDLLPTLDYFDAAMNSLPKLNVSETVKKAFDSWILGIAQVQKLMISTLEQHGVLLVDTNSMFDTSLHEAVEEQESDEPAGTILKVVANGYKLNDKLIRPAKVIISKGE